MYTASQFALGRRAGLASKAEGQHHARCLPGSQLGQSLTSGSWSVNHNRPKGIAHCGLKGNFPSRVNDHQIKEKTHDAVGLEQTFCATPGPDIVEGQTQRFGAGDPAVEKRIGFSLRIPGLLSIGFRHLHCVIGGFTSRHQRIFFVSKGGKLTAKRRGVGLKLLTTAIKFRQGTPETFGLAGAAFDTGPQRPQLTTNLGGFTAGHRDAIAPAFLKRHPIPGQRGFFFGKASRIGSERLAFIVNLGQLMTTPFNLVFKAGDHRLISKRLTVTVHPSLAFGQQRSQTTAAFSQRLQPSQCIAKIVASERRQVLLVGAHCSRELLKFLTGRSFLIHGS